MFSIKLLSRSLAAGALIIGLASFAFADTIRLKNGSVLYGKITSFSGGKFVMVIGQGERQREMTFFADEIESIEFDGAVSSPSIPTAEPKLDTTPPFTERTDGNETIITVGGSRPVLRNAEPSPKRDEPQVDPDAVAVDPDPSSTAETTDDEPLVIDDTIDSDPIGDDPPQPSSDPVKPGPVRIEVRVMADDTANGWTNAGLVVKRGQKIRVISNGRISLGNGRTTGPGGLATLPDANKLISDRPTGSLIAVIGDDNNDFIFIGENREIIAERDGALFLGVNEGNLNDNSGSFDVIIEIEVEGS